mmetsp:Transcript_44974/g.114994  ORF Transcript_44974/g.114994 Transcript_44974/m.114994 type:complete len:218 (+) Transcript_44974:357-1010(+)
MSRSLARISWTASIDSSARWMISSMASPAPRNASVPGGSAKPAIASSGRSPAGASRLPSVTSPGRPGMPTGAGAAGSLPDSTSPSTASLPAPASSCSRPFTCSVAACRAATTASSRCVGRLAEVPAPASAPRLLRLEAARFFAARSAAELPTLPSSELSSSLGLMSETAASASAAAAASMSAAVGMAPLAVAASRAASTSAEGLSSGAPSLSRSASS